MAEAYLIRQKQATYNTVIFWLHGLGATAEDLVPLAEQLDFPESIQPKFIFPQAPVRPISVFQQQAVPAWYDILATDITSQQDEVGIRASADLLQTLVETEIVEGCSAERIVLAGFSQGAAMALHVALRFPQRLAGVVALSGYLPLAETLTQETALSNHGLPIFIGHGRLDPIVPMLANELTVKQLQAHDYNVTSHEYNMGHEVCPEEITDINQWLVTEIVKL